MSELERVTAAFKKADALAQQGDEKAREDAAMFAREIRRLQAQSEPSGPTEFLGQAARSIGGAADFLTAPGQAAGEYLRELQGFEPSENPERAVTDALVAARIASPEGPQNVVGSAGAGMGDAMAALLPVAGALNQLRTVGGVTGAVADDVLKYLTTKSSVFAIEPLSGAASGGASRAVKDAGGNEFMQTAAGMAAPLAVPLAGEAVRQGGRIVRGVQSLADRGILAATDALGATTAPTNGLPRRGPLQAVRETVTQALIPQTQAGARITAANRARQVVGEESRYRVADGIDPEDPLGRTAADQTGDPGLLALQQERMNVDPDFRERLSAQREGVRQSLVEEVRSIGGDPSDAKAFFRRRFVQFKKGMKDRIDAVEAEAGSIAEAAGPKNLNTENSRMVSEAVQRSYDNMKLEESRLWNAVPKDVTVKTERIKDRAQFLKDTNAKAGSGDVPELVDRLLSDAYGETESVFEIHQLASKLLEIERNARNGTGGSAQNGNLARIAGGVARAAMSVLDDVPGRQIAEARAHTRALHTTYHVGAVGKLLDRTRQGTLKIRPEETLARVPPTQGNIREITDVAPEAGENIQDFLRDGFNKALTGGEKINPAAARRFIQQNREAFREYPELQKELIEASRKQDEAKAYAARMQERIKVVQGGPSMQFSLEEPDLAADMILGAKNPQRAARQIMRDAKRDQTGAAVEGVKGAISARLEAKYEKLPDLLKDQKIKAALSQVYNGREMVRLTKVSEVLENMGATPSSIGAILNEPNNILMDTVVRVGAAKVSSVLGADNAGVGLQQAQIASSRARDLLSRMTNKKAREILFKAIEDPELMKVLLTEETQNLSQRAIAKLTPYLVGGAAGVEE